MSTATLDEVDLVRSVCRDSYFAFVREFWSEISEERPVWNWHVEYLCGIRQAAAERVFKRKKRQHHYIVNVPPGSTKSTIFSVLFLPWAWVRDPSIRVINASYDEKLALELSLKCRRVLRSEKYQRCFPEVQVSKDQDAKGFFVNTRGGCRISVGVGQNITGRHAHFLDVDDPLNPEASFSKPELEVVNRWMSETLPTRMVDKGVSVISLIMQRLHEFDPTGDWLGRDYTSIKHICLPAEVDGNEDDVKPAYLLERYEGGLLDPVRLARDVLVSQRTALGQYAFACQYLQTPIPRGGGAFHTDMFVIERVPPNQKTDLIRVVRYWDKAATGGGGAWTVGVKMAVDRQGRFWVLDVVRVQLESSRREALIKQTAQLDGPTVKIIVEQEPGSGGKESAEATVRNLAGYMVFLDRPHGKKEMRADPFSIQVNAGNVRLVEAPWNKTYIDELKIFDKGKYKDQVDASSGAFNDLVQPNIVCGAF